ncbi:ALP1-like protein isoform X1 [Tanacetum coccineum]
MSDSSAGMSDPDDIDDMKMIMQQFRYEQSLQEQEAESSNRRNYIYRERDVAEEHLMEDYFGDKKYPTIMLEAFASYDLWIWHAFCGVAGANNDITVLNNSPLFDDLFDDIAPVAPFKVNGVTFQQGYYLVDVIYPQWSSFVKSFSVANSEKNALFKQKQESAQKDVERAFGVL